MNSRPTTCCAFSGARQKLSRLFGKLAIGAMACVSVAAAQEPGDPAVLEEVVVTATPIKDSIEESLLRQQAAENVVNVIASDTIGRFPDTTAAAALARLPAVAVQRDQGQERYIQVRGAPARWTAVAVDGINVLGAEERIFRFDSVPAALIDSVVLNKTLTPDMPAEALAGRVDIQTFSALDNPGFTGYFDLGLGYVDLADGDQEQYAARLGWSDERWGVVVAGSHFMMEQQTDNNEFDYDEAGAPILFDFRKYQLERETNSFSGKLEFAPDADHRFVLSSLYTEFLDHELRNMYQLDLDGAQSGTRTAAEGDLVQVPMSGYLQDGNYENSTFTNTLGGDHRLSDWDLGWRLNYTETEQVTDLPLVIQIQTDPSQMPSLHYDRSDPKFPRVSLYTTDTSGEAPVRGTPLAFLPQTSFGLNLLNKYGTTSESEAYMASLEAGRDWTLWGADSRLSFGLQYDSREATGSPGPIAFPVPLDYAQYVTDEPWDTDFERGVQGTYVDNVGLREELERTLEEQGLTVPLDPTLAYEVTEEILAGFAMNRWSFGRHQVLAGVRIESVDITSDGTIKEENGDPQALSVSKSYTDVFPSIHWNLDVREDLKFRLSGVSGIARPTFAEQRSSAIIVDDEQLVDGGNPDLNPETAYGIDSSLEWYFARASLLSLNLFYRLVDDVLFPSVTTVSDDRFDTEGADRTGYAYSTTLNGSDGELYGAELAYTQPWSFLPPALFGFGFEGSVSVLDGEFKTPEGRTAGFPGTSDTVMNAAFFYENFGWSLRLSWQWRSEWIDDISVDADSDYYWDETERLDFSARYQVNDWLTVYGDANNLTDELGVRYQGSPERPVEVEGFGRRYMMGLRAVF